MDDVIGEWRQEGRCSSCALFEADFGEIPDLYGHCKMYKRSGAREARDFACGEYEPSPGFAALTKSAAHERVYTDPTFFVKETRQSSRRRTSGGGHRATPPPPKRVLPPLSDTLEALFGEGGDVDRDTIRDVLVDVIESVIGIEDVQMANKWEGGTIELHPADGDMASSHIPIEALFKKVVSVRNQLRVLESKINGHGALNSGEKIELQQYISRCYGSLTTFNVLFKQKEDKFSSK